MPGVTVNHYAEGKGYAMMLNAKYLLFCFIYKAWHDNHSTVFMNSFSATQLIIVPPTNTFHV